MKNQNNKLFSILSWLLPSGSELATISALSVLTVVISSASFFRSLVFLPKGFELKSAILNSVNDLVVRLVGDHIARSAVVAIFWAFVGLLVYILIWIVLNFSDEFGNDLATTKYMHPRNVDTTSPLRSFLSRVSFQLVTLFVFILYINFVVAVLLPYCGGLFHTAIEEWPKIIAFRYIISGFALELIVLHFIAVLVRVLVLRKRVFG